MKVYIVMKETEYMDEVDTVFLSESDAISYMEGDTQWIEEHEVIE